MEYASLLLLLMLPGARAIGSQGPVCGSLRQAHGYSFPSAAVGQLPAGTTADGCCVACAAKASVGGES